jgi:hypothetical protein
MGLLCGRAGRLTHKNAGFRPGQWCAVSEWELDLLGAEPADRDLLAGTPAPPTFAFAHVLYEMALGGARLTSNALPPGLPGVPLPLAQALDRVFNQPIGDSYAPVAVADILRFPVFADARLR